MKNRILSLVLMTALLAASACTSVHRISTKANVEPLSRGEEFPRVIVTVKDEAPQVKGKKTEFLGKGSTGWAYLLLPIFPMYLGYAEVDIDQPRQDLIAQSAIKVLAERKIPAAVSGPQAQASTSEDDFRLGISLQKLKSFGTGNDDTFILIGAIFDYTLFEVDATVGCDLYSPRENRSIWSGSVDSVLRHSSYAFSSINPGRLFEAAVSKCLEAAKLGERYGAVMEAKAEKAYAEADAALAAGNYAKARERYLYGDSLVRDFNIEARLRAMRGLAAVMKHTSEPPQTEEVKDLLAKGKAAGKVADNDNERVAMVDYFKKAAELAPWDASIHFKLAASFEELKAYAAACGELKLYLALKDDPAENDRFRSKLAELEMQAAKS